jgi:hypothetical protein
MRPRAWMALAALVLLLLAGWLIVARRGARPLAVELGEVARRDTFRSYVTASGEVVATRFADIGSSVMGRGWRSTSRRATG